MNFQSSNNPEPLHYVINVPQPPGRPSSPTPLLVSSAVADERYAICKECPQFRQLTRQCGICNCLMPIKVRFQGQNCPEKRWPASTSSTQP